MKLSTLIDGMNLSFNKDMDILGATSDSRVVKPGFLFAAVSNGISNGNDYILKAIENGATAILCEASAIPQQNNDTQFIVSKNPNKDYSKLLSRFYEKQPENICAITGTNGKTSIADFVRQVLTSLGENAASIGTLGLIKGNNAPLPYANTTPGADQLHKDLMALAEDRYNFVAIETSSHGICQYRIGGIKFKAAGFTNLTQDHLDYHKNLRNYFEAKKLLFTDILPVGGTAVLNADIDVFDELKQACLATGKKVIGYGRKGEEIRLLEVTPQSGGQLLKIRYFGETKEIFIPLAGEFQAMNVLCALGLLHVIYGKDNLLLEAIGKIHGAKGRLEYIGKSQQGGDVYVDYAHTPDALENVICSMRPYTKNKLHIVFGCGGDRDKTKRPLMGNVAEKLADVVYVTDDNPRTENPEDIRNQVMEGCPNARNIGDRKEAIRQAIEQLQYGDVLIVAGKGHETGQYVNGQIIPFSDQEICAEFLK